MKRVLVVLALAIVVTGAWLVYRTRTAPPRVPLVRVTRQTLESTLTTNGKTEPIRWMAARAERDGAVKNVPVALGQRVAAGAVLAVIANHDAEEALRAAEARIAQAQAETRGLEQGGRPTDRAVIDASVAALQASREALEREAATVERLVARQAATRQELAALRDRIQAIDVDLKSAARRRAALANPPEAEAARARLREAEAAAAAARRRLGLGVVKAPMAGVIYQLDARPGAYVTPGTPIALIGETGHLRVTVFVDEPELGRVRTGLPVTITWDSLPGRSWTGAVASIAPQIVALNTRQIAEVVCLVEEGAGLLPGANINASILTHRVENTLVLPKEVLRRQGGQTGVYVLDGPVLRWRVVRTGVSNVTTTEVVEGLKEGDNVAGATEQVLSDGLSVAPPG
ncbi:MAG: efflux RND transporter periplasmic adaptor subunit [Acidobacteria bacterium]|nr:efflux RND transporter periplasmic adaptor subunit [Acidobacteriota bacterium]